MEAQAWTAVSALLGGYRDDGTEWWRLVSRQEEFIEKKDLERIAREI
jgi:hypothetical protein